MTMRRAVLFILAEAYNRKRGYAAPQMLPPLEMTPDEWRRIARGYDALQVENPAAVRSYEHMVAEEASQYDMVSHYFKIEPWPHEGQPYSCSAAMRADVLEHSHLWVFTGGDAHPIRSAHEIYAARAVHDLFGHVLADSEFGPAGELAATRMHAQMYRRGALPALITDNLGQAAWYFYGSEKREWPEQKIDCLPEFLWHKLLT